MKKVLVVFTTAFVRTGGLASVMLNYWRAMDKRGLSFDFASTNKIEDSLYMEISTGNSHYYQLPPRHHILAYFNLLLKICRGYDIIHIHANSATSVIELSAASLAGVKKRIHHNHSSKTLHPYLNKLLRPLLTFTCTDAVACSKKAGDWLFGKDNYLVLPNAIDINRYKFEKEQRNMVRKEFNIANTEFVIGHIGKFMDAKNHEFLIKVFACFHSKRPDSKLLMVGDGPWRSKIEKWVRESGCAESIILAGLRSDIPSIIQAFDIFVFPSIYEGMPLSVIEAQASGLPCIVSSNISSELNLGRDVVMKDLSDEVNSWADSIDLFDYGLREQRCMENQKLLTEGHFNIKREANELAKLYNC